MTVFEAYNHCKKKLEAAGVPDYGFEARALLRKATGYTNAQILSKYNQPLTTFQQNNLIAMIHQREARYPLQYMFGEWDFYGLPFRVGPGVLIPRADTETAVEQALDLLKETESPKVLDLCAGSGCIGISIAKNRSDAAVSMVEKYKEALRYLEQNIELNEVKNCTVEQADIFENPLADEKYHLIISNPPYVEAEDMTTLQPEVGYEPDTALYGGEDGLMFYRAIILGYKDSLLPGGHIVFEVGERQAAAVCGMLLEAGFETVDTKTDLNGVVRVVFGTAKSLE